MNLSLISSFIIGGILLLMMLKVNVSMVETSAESMNDQLAKQNIDVVAQIISYDMRKVGFGTGDSSIVTANVNEISFRTDLEDDMAINQITWRFDNTNPNTYTPNPHDYILTRRVDGVDEPIYMGVTNVTFKYMDELNNVTTQPNQVRKIHVRVECQSSEPVDGTYQKAMWEKTFVPINLNM